MLHAKGLQVPTHIGENIETQAGMQVEQPDNAGADSRALEPVPEAARDTITAAENISAEGPTIIGRLLSLPLFYKVLIANSAIVLFGALAGTEITARVVASGLSESNDVRLAAIFAVCGLLLSGVLNAIVLRAAFSPLQRLQDVARQVSEGDFSVRASPSPLADAEVAQVADALNVILDEVQEYEGQMRALSGRVISAQEEERQRIARELHDDTGQVLTLLLIRLKLLESQAPTETMQAQLTELRGLVSGAIDRVRQLALALRPPAIDQLGLAPALRSLVSTYTTNTRIAVKLEISHDTFPLSPERTIAVYRIAQEALTNIAKHASARNVVMSVAVDGPELTLTVRDDGTGFDVAHVAHHGQPATGGPGMGLFGMEERARLAGGRLRIASAPGRGTSITLRVPLDPIPQETRDEPAAPTAER